jgi:hypothetical protein
MMRGVSTLLTLVSEGCRWFTLEIGCQVMGICASGWSRRPTPDLGAMMEGYARAAAELAKK